MWFKIQDKEVKLHILAKPNAKKTSIVKITEQELHVAIKAKPHKGEANKELIIFLSKVFDLPKSHIILKAGESSKHKQVLVPLTKTVQKILSDPEKFR